MVTLRFSDFQQQDKIAALLETESLQFLQTKMDLCPYAFMLMKQIEIFRKTLYYQLKPG